MVKSKKGDATEIVFLSVFMIFLAISFIVVLFVNDKFHEIVTTTALNNSASSADIAGGLDLITTKTGQQGFAIIMGGLVIVLMASAFLIREFPIFLIVYIITMSVGLFVAVIGENLYEQVTANASLAAIASQQDIINLLMGRATLFILGAGALSMFIAFAKIVAPSVNVGGGDI